ncbi:MAG: ABC transporter ATP-binding protein [Pseudomonadota bacterium]|nr:ABC transporter ATP-binding protein [Pseudomonadota bacterium]
MSNAINLRDLKFRWHRDKPWTLDIPYFEVGRGEKVFIQGPSGSGKTTLLNLIGGIVLADKGQITIENTDLAALRPSARDNFRGENIGFIFQMFNLVPYLSVLDNVLLPYRFSRQRQNHISGDVSNEAIRLLGRMGIDDSGLVTRRVTDLSVGQQQRVAAARALLGAPRLIVADEPTSALDEDNRKAFIDLLFAETNSSGATLIFVSHDMALSSTFDTSVSLRDLNRAR